MVIHINKLIKRIPPVRLTNASTALFKGYFLLKITQIKLTKARNVSKISLMDLINILSWNIERVP